MSEDRVDETLEAIRRKLDQAIENMEEVAVAMDRAAASLRVLRSDIEGATFGLILATMGAGAAIVLAFVLFL